MPSNSFSPISFAESGLNAPGNWRAAPGVSILRSARRLAAGVLVEYNMLEQALRCGRCVDDALCGLDVQLVQFACSQVFKVFCGRDEAVDFRVVHQAGGQGAELVDVLLAGERTGTQWVRVGYGDLIGDHGAVVQGDLNRAAEGLLRDI